VEERDELPLASEVLLHDVIWYGISLWPVEVSYPNSVSSQTPTPFTENGLGSVQHRLAETINITNTFFLTTKPQHYTRTSEENNLVL